MKILLADDSKFMRTILKNILGKMYADAEFFEAANGVEAIGLHNEHAPNIMLLDLIMPEKGGIDVLTDIGAKKTGKIIIISAIGQEKVIEDAKKLGADAFIVKPFDEKMVIEVVERAMRPA